MLISGNDTRLLCALPEAEFASADPSTEPLISRDEDIERASRDREVSVQDIVEAVGTSQSNISQHLAILRDKGILASRKDANRVYYRVGDSRTLRLICMMRDVFCSHG